MRTALTDLLGTEYPLLQGGMASVSTAPLADRDDLSLAYTPGVALVCEAIAPGDLVVMCAFGAGLMSGALLMEWGA